MLIMDIAYGIDVLPVGDPYIDTAEKALASVSIATMPGAFLVDLIPARTSSNMLLFSCGAHSFGDVRSQVCPFMAPRGWIQAESQSMESANDDHASRPIQCLERERCMCHRSFQNTDCINVSWTSVTRHCETFVWISLSPEHESHD